MKTTTLTLLALTLGFSALHAQDESKTSAQAGSEPRRPQPPLVVAALDTNADGVIDASEIANSSVALLTLDKDSDGKLTAKELRRPRPSRASSASAGAAGTMQKRRAASSSE